jgi:hypothetical protein
VYPKNRIALSAAPGGFLDRVARELGTVVAIGEEGWLEKSNVVVVDCSDTSMPRYADYWRHILDVGKTLGLAGMRAEDRATLQKIVGRALRESRKNLFVRRAPSDPERYTFTVAPDFDHNTDPAKVAAFLTERVFVGSPPKPVAPPAAINNIWPLNSDIGRLFASTQPMISGWQPGGSGPYGSSSQVTFNAVGYFFLANGSEGDNNYHVIIVSRMSSVVGLEPTGADFGFGLRVTPNVAPTNVYSTQPFANNSPPPPQSWGYLGNYICTSFGHDPQIQINILGTPPGSNRQQTFLLYPTFDEYRNPVSTPGIDNFFVVPGDSSLHSEVQFNMLNTLIDFSSVAKSQHVSNPVESRRVDIDAGDNSDAFVVLSYFTFANLGGPSFQVNFGFEVGFFYWWSVLHGYIFQQSSQTSSVPIDLVAATQLAPVG